jgi:hypothetical protein
MKSNLQVGNKIAKMRMWGNNFHSVFVGFRHTEDGYYPSYIIQETPTFQPDVGIYIVTAVRQDYVEYTDEKPWNCETVLETFFRVDGWAAEYRMSEDDDYWIQVSGDGWELDAEIGTLQKQFPAYWEMDKAA